MYKAHAAKANRIISHYPTPYVCPIALLVLALFWPLKIHSIGVLPEGLHRVPVLITMQIGNEKGYGSGVYLWHSNSIYLTTAAHVLFDHKSTNFFQLNQTNCNVKSFASGWECDERSIGSLDLKCLLESGFIRRHPLHDIVVVRIGVTLPLGTNALQQLLWHKGVSFTTPSNTLSNLSITEAMLPFKEVPDGSEAYILGYPAELLANGFRPEVDFDVPLIRKGTISQKNKNTQKLIIDSGVYGGNSGGPVFVVKRSLSFERYSLVGLITRFVPVKTRVVDPTVGDGVLMNSGYGVAEPIEHALELMNQFEDLSKSLEERIAREKKLRGEQKKPQGRNST